MRNRTVPEEQALAVMQRELARGLVLQQLAQAARELGHEPSGCLRSDTEHASVCSRCGARIYARVAVGTVTDGEALSEPCPAA